MYYVHIHYTGVRTSTSRCFNFFHRPGHPRRLSSLFHHPRYFVYLTSLLRLPLRLTFRFVSPPRSFARFCFCLSLPPAPSRWFRSGSLFRLVRFTPSRTVRSSHLHTRLSLSLSLSLSVMLYIETAEDSSLCVGSSGSNSVRSRSHRVSSPRSDEPVAQIRESAKVRLGPLHLAA